MVAGMRITSAESLPPLADAPQAGQPLADQVLVRREGVVGQGFPVGEQHAADVGREEGNFFDQALGVCGVRRHDGGGAALGFFALGQLGQQQGVGVGGGAGQGKALARGQFG